METSDNQDHKEKSHQEKRIRNITNMYYSRKDIQEAIFNFSKNREISPRYFEGFGKRPDSFQFKGDIFQLVKRGATSFHCSEEHWENPLKLSTEMTKKEMNDLRTGWDLIIDIDCKWIEYSKRAAQAIIQTLRESGIKNIGLKYSGNKGFHIVVPWEAFPEEINDIKTSNLFPELPRKLANFIRFHSEQNLKKILPDDFYKQFKDTNISKGIKCNRCNEIVQEYFSKNFICPECKRQELREVQEGDEKEYKCPECNIKFDVVNSIKGYRCNNCKINSQDNPEDFSKTEEIDLFELMGLDIVLVSPRHLFRMPYSLHEKTSLSSIVISLEDLEKFEIKDADPLRVKVKPFIPRAEKNEAKEFVLKALDWTKDNDFSQDQEEVKGKYADYKINKIKSITEDIFPPSIKKILEGLKDGRKRALFILINYFRSIGMEKENMEKRIEEWNQKNAEPLNEGYITTQLSWSYKRKPKMPPNFDKDYYKGIGIPPRPEELKAKNPVTFTLQKDYIKNKRKKKSSKR
jgi:DNA primase catalytic subunit